MTVLVERGARRTRDEREVRTVPTARAGRGAERATRAHDAAGHARVAEPLRAFPRKGETRRPPTRARVVAGHRPDHVVARCAPRRPGYRWPALAALGVAVCLAVVGLGLFANAIVSAGEVPVPSRTTVVSVAPGDTLETVAGRFAPDSEPAAVVERIQELNRLDGAAITAGEPLVVPVQR